LLKDDCYIPQLRNTDPCDKARTAMVSVTSEKAGHGAENVINGVTRPENGADNLWISDGISQSGETVALKLNRAETVSEVRLIFDTNFNYSNKQTQATKRQKQQRIGTPPELVRDYTVRLWKNGGVIAERTVTDNTQRSNVITFQPVECDTVTVTVAATNGCDDVHIYEVRLY